MRDRRRTGCGRRRFRRGCGRRSLGQARKIPRKVAEGARVANLIDRLYLLITPEIAGGGEQLFVDGLPGSKWHLTSQEAGELGEIAVVYDRKL